MNVDSLLGMAISHCKSSKHDKYRQLKSRFKKRLLNTLYFLDINQPANPNYERAYYNCHKDWTLVKILLNYHLLEFTPRFLKSMLNNGLHPIMFHLALYGLGIPSICNGNMRSCL